MKRRAFLKTVSGAVGAGTLASQTIVHAAESAAAADQGQAAGLPRRVLGALAARCRWSASPDWPWPATIRQPARPESTRPLREA